MRVVLFEDEPDIAYMQQTLLTRFGCQVETPSIRQREELNWKIRWSETDVAIVDLMMPHLGGDVIVRWIKQHQPHVRVLLVTAAPSQIPDDLPADVILVKPFHVDDLYRAVNHGYSA